MWAMPITRETLRLQQQLRNDVLAITDQQVRDMTKAWVDAWGEVSADLELSLLQLIQAAKGKRVTKAMLIRSERLTRALTAVNDQLHQLAKDTNTRLTADVDSVVRSADQAQWPIIRSQLPPVDIAAVDFWARSDPRQINAIIRRTTQQITSLSWPIERDASVAVKRELVRGIAGGLNPRQVARQMVARAEGRFNGGLARAATIARTEMLDANRSAGLASREANKGLMEAWQWHAELADRTCSACWSMDGSLHPVEDPGPDGHQNCRCTAIPVMKSWAELGFSGMVEPRSIKPDAHSTFVALPDASQKRILGPARWNAWKAGSYPMEKWATVRHTPGWRDSVGVSPLPSEVRATRGVA